MSRPSVPVRARARLWAALACALSAPPVAAADDLADTLRPLLAKHGFPAVAAAVVVEGKVVAAGAVGTRRAGADIPVTVNDRFHLGSDTKAMTATVIGMLVEAGKLRWDSTPLEVFPELAAAFDEGVKPVTLEQLLSHTSGVSPDDDTFDKVLADSQSRPGDLGELRRWVVKRVVARPLLSKPGEKFAYANMNYVVAGAMAERVTGRTWDELVTDKVFAPLGLTTAGLGCQASVGKVDAPLPHRLVDGKTVPVLAGPNGDNPLVIGPAGIAHMSVLDFAAWAGWNAGQGKRGPALVKPETLRKLHAPVVAMPTHKDAPPGTPREGKYGLGWGQLTVDWAPHPLAFHGGSNTMNFAQVWLDTRRDAAVVVVTNVGGDEADKALLAAVKPLFLKYVGPPAGE